MAWFAVLVAVSGCGNDTEGPGDSGVMSFAADDPEMEAAIRQARESVGAFIAELPTLRAEGDYYSVKVPINKGTAPEHVWLDVPDFKDGSFSGKLGNVPLSGPLKLGDVLSAPSSEISDWLAVRNGELFGGFTILVERAHLSPAECEEFDRSLGLPVPAAARTF